MSTSDVRTSIIVAICTYKRNEELKILLQALMMCADRVRSRAAVGVVIVDDNKEETAKNIAVEFTGLFELGVTYCISGRQNISIARNLAIEAAMRLGEWTAMTDDDCEPAPEWLEALLEAQRQTKADAVTGLMIRRVPADSPRWIKDQPFLDLGTDSPTEGALLTTAYTNNSMVSSQWLRNHPHIRFDPSLGTLGGEDMVFYRTARAEGLKIHFSAKAFVYENEPASRATLAYQLRRFLWHGNSSYVSSVASGVKPYRMLIHGIASLGRAMVRPLLRILRGQRPQWRYCLASILEACGKVIGFFGVRIKHQ